MICLSPKVTLSNLHLGCLPDYILGMQGVCGMQGVLGMSAAGKLAAQTISALGSTLAWKEGNRTLRLTDHGLELRAPQPGLVCSSNVAVLQGGKRQLGGIKKWRMHVSTHAARNLR